MRDSYSPPEIQTLLDPPVDIDESPYTPERSNWEKCRKYTMELLDWEEFPRCLKEYTYPKLINPVV